MAQLGTSGTTEPREFRRRVQRWLQTTLALRPACPARISENGRGLIVSHASAIGRRVSHTSLLIHQVFHVIRYTGISTRFECSWSFPRYLVHAYSRPQISETTSLRKAPLVLS
jgi:hypothetical protein